MNLPFRSGPEVAEKVLGGAAGQGGVVTTPLPVGRFTNQANGGGQDGGRLLHGGTGNCESDSPSLAQLFLSGWWSSVRSRGAERQPAG